MATFRKAAAIFAAVAAASATLTACGDRFGVEESIALSETDIRRLELWQGRLPIEMRETRVTAAHLAAAEPAAMAAVDGAERVLAAVDGPRARRPDRVDAAFLPLLIDTAAGRSFLRASPDGRALAMGAPAADCPAIGLAMSAETPAAAADAALGACLNALDAAPRFSTVDCGCRVIALGDVLIAERDAFGHARAVSAIVIDPDSDARIPLSSELTLSSPDLADSAQMDAAVLEAELAGSERLVLATAAGPAATLETDASGGAVLTMSESGARYVGQWRVEGLRRGRQAGVAAVLREDGRPLLLLIGYAPTELLQREDELLAIARSLL